jgi:hypothetical protein
LGIGSRVASDGKMNGLHGPKHRRGDFDRECGRPLFQLSLVSFC